VTARTAADYRRELRARRRNQAADEVFAALEGKLFADVPQVATVLRSDERTVRRSLASGDIPGIRTGTRWRVPTRWLREAAGLETTEAGS
jgi:excisionase family DNA binding protein